MSAPKTFSEIASRYPAHPRYLLAALQDVQAAYRHVPKEAICLLADYMKIPKSQVFGVVTFYRALSLDVQGEKTVRVCMGTACHLRGAPKILKAATEELGIKPGETTEDKKFTLSTVSCVGACALAPVMMIEENTYGALKSAGVREALDKERGHD